MRVSYLCLEQSAVGSAADAHLKGFFEQWPEGSLVVTRASHRADDALRVKIVSIGLALWRFVQTFQHADVVGARAHPLVALGILPGRLTGKRIFLFLQGRPDDLPGASPFYRVLGWISAVSIARALRWADVVFATSEGLLGWARSQSQGAVIQVTNGVDVGRFPWPVEGKRGVVFVGTPAPWQGLSTLLEAVASPNWPDDLPLTVIGVSRPKAHLMIDARVTFLGRLPPNEVAEVLSRSAIGVSPKRLDRATRMGVSPFKMAEYHGAGLAVLASDVPGQREMINASKGGALFKPDSASEIASIVQLWHAHPKRLETMQGNARRFAEEELTWEAQRFRIRRALLE